MRKIIALLSKIKVMLPIGSLLLVPWFLVACDNGPKVSSIDGIQSAVKMTIFNDAGSGQVLAPKQATGDSIIFTIRDGSGKAVPEAAISFKLIDVTGLTEINPDQLIAAWDAGKNSISTQTADPLATEEDVIGRIESAESKTDAQGQARVKLVAPDAYEKTIAVAARVQSGGTAAKDSGFGFATISTSGFGQSETYIFTTSRALQEITGEPFAISITAVREGRIVKALNGKRKFEFSSWSVGRIVTDKFPKGEVDCVFINGTCRLDGGPFILMGAGQLNLKFRDTGSSIPEQEVQIELERGRPSALVLSSTPGPILTIVCSSLQQPEAGKPCITFSADSDAVTLYPAIIDQGQNFVSTPPTKWSVSGVLERRIGAASATENQTIQPYKSGTGFFTVSGENFTLTASYSVVPGQPAAYLVSSENGGSEIATNPFKVKIKLFDRKENFCSNFSRDLAVRASLVGASPSPGGNLPVSSLTEVIPFVFGEGVSTQTLLATKAGEKPKINVQGAEGVADSDLLTILPGPTKSVKFRTAANNLGNLLDQPITLATDTRANFFVAGYDKFLNYTGETNSDFVGTDALATSLAVTSGSATTVIPTVTGSGTIIATPKLAGVSAIISPLINVSSNVAAAFDIITTHNNTEQAGVRFQIKLRARDLSNFIAVSYEGTKSLQFISYAPPAWSGQAGLLPDGVLTCTFVQGLCDLPAPAGDTGWYVTDKDIPALVSVTELAGQVTGVWSNFIVSTQGPVDRVLFADKVGGEATGAIPIAANTLKEITTDNTISLGAALVDKGGNFISNANATWTGTAVLVTPYFNTASPSASNVFNPVKVISAADNAEIRAQSAGATDAVLRVIASHGVANRIDINLPGGTNLTAGDCVPFTATVVDADGNATTSFNKQLTLQAGMLNSNTTTHAASAYRHGYFNSWDNGGPDLRFLTGFYYLNGNNDWQQAILDYDPVFSDAPYEYAPAGGWRRSGSLNTLVLNGVINFPYKVCVSDATNVAPQIVMALPAPLDNSYPAVSGTSSVISVSLSSPYQVKFFQQNGQQLCPIASHQKVPTTGPLFAWEGSGETAYRDQIEGTVYNYCLPNHSADTSQVQMVAHLIDKGGNDLGLASGTWAVDSSIGIPSGANIISQTANSLTVNTTVSGDYKINFTDTATQISNGMMIEGVSGVPTRYEVTPYRPLTANGNTTFLYAIFATVTFAVDLRLYDQHSNEVTNWDGARSVTFAWQSTPASSPLGTAPAKASNGTVNFIDGNYQTARVFRLPSAGVSTLVTTLSGITPSTLSTAIDSQPGFPATIHIQDAPTLSGQDIGTLNLTTDSDVSWYVVGKDTELNITNNADFTTQFTVNGVLSPNFTVTGNSIRLLPDRPGTGSIVATPSDNYGNSYPVATTGTITVDDGAIDHFLLTMPSNPSNVTTAGTAYNLSLKAVDKDNNTISTYTGTKVLTWSSVGSTLNAESRSIGLPADGSYTFVNGVCTDTLSLTPYNKTNTPVVSVSTPEPSKGVLTGSLSLTVNAGAFDHYGVDTVTDYTPRSSLANVFSATVYLRDVAGNNLTTGGPGTAVSLSIVRSDGSAAAGSLHGTTTGLLPSTTGSATVNNLAYDDGGTYRLVAADASYTTPASATNLITMWATRALVKDYLIGLPAGTPLNLTAGQPFTLTITARNNYNNAITGADNNLNSSTFTWQGPSNAPDSTAPSLPTLNFVNGVASHQATFYKAETISSGNFILTDNQTTPKTGASSKAIVVGVGAISMYDISSSETARTADSQSTGLFNVTINCFDAWHNPRAGDSALNLVAVYQSGTATTVGEILGSSGTSAETSGLNLSSGSLSLTGLRYTVGHTIKFNVTGGSAGAGTSTTVVFTANINTVSTYRVTAPSSVSAGASNAAVTVSARDAAGNVITGIDAALNAQTYTWTGSASSPNGTAPVYGSLTSFSSGVATTTHSLYQATTLTSQTLRISDNYGSGARSGGNIASLVINPLAAVSLTAGTLGAQTAGTGFTITATAKDTYGNLTANGCTTMSMTGGSTSPGAHGGSATAPSLSSAVSQATLGNYSSNLVTLYNEAVHSISLSACSLSASLSITVNEAAASTVYLSTTDSPPASQAITELLCANGTGAAVACSALYAFFWDAYGNRVDDTASACTAWSYTNISGSGTPSVSGATHALTLSHSSYIDGNLTCTKGGVSRSINTYGGVSRLAYTHNYNGTSVEAGYDNITVSGLQLYFRKNNVEIAKSDAATQTIAVTTTSTLVVGTTPSPGSIGQAASLSCAFNGSGACATSYAFDMTKVETGVSLTLTVRGAALDITGITVTPSNPSTLTIAAISNKTAGTAFTASVTVKDAFDNLTAKSCGNLSVSGGSSSPGGHGGSVTAPVLPSAVAQGSVGTYTTGNITLYNKASTVLTFSACSLSNTATVVVDEAAANAVYLTTTNSAPASHTSSLRCANSTGASVACAAVYGFFWDVYGNQVDSTNNACTSWSYTNISGSGTPTVSGATHSLTLTHTSYIDGNLTCTKGSASASINTYGGVSRVALTHNYSTAIPAALDNITVSAVQLYYQQAGSEVQKADAGTETITVSTTSALGVPAIGQAASLSCAFSASGICSTAYPFDMTLTESNVSITLAVRGVSSSISAITVNPANASVLSVAAISSKLAGQSFTASATVLDSFGNFTSGNCTTLSTTGGTTSPGAHGGSATAPSLPAAAALSSVGHYTTGNISLYSEGSNTLSFSACGLSTNASVTVTEAAVNAVYLSSTDSPPASHTSELLCANSSGASVSCAQVFAFFWDAYGNRVDDSASACTSWSYTNISGSGTPSVSGATHGLTLTHNNYIDGNLTCTKAGVSASILTYGGVSRVGLSHNYATSVIAALDNITVSGIQLYYQKNNVETQKTDAGAESIAVSTTSSLGVPAIGQAASLVCAFSASGLCSTAYPFDMTLTESNVSITLAVRGVSSSISAITVNPANASVLSVAAIGSKLAGQSFTASATVLDSFGNFTSGNCTTLSTTGGTTSPGAHGGTATAPSLPAAAALSSVGHYTTGNISLYSEGSNTLSFSACGLSTNASVTVTEAAVNAVYLSSTDSPPASHTSELLCANSSGASVSCAQVYAFFWDAYGNRVDDSASACTSWSYTNISGSGTPSVSGATHGLSLTHNNYIDGNLTCTKAGVSASILTYGGVSRVGLSHNYATSVVAALDNITVSGIQLYYQKNNVETQKTDAGAESIAVSTTSSLGVPAIGQAASLVCAFSASGLCSTSYPFDMTRTESNVSITLTVRGMASTISAINVNPAVASTLTAAAISSKQAGVAFTASATVLDAFANATSSNCTTLSTTGGTTSPGAHGGTATAPSLPAAAALGSVGAYTTGNITLYAEGSNTLSFSACGLSTTAGVTVTEAATNAVYLATTDSAPGSHTSELLCANSTGASVACSTLYAFFWDAYGNQVDDTASACTSWSYTNDSGSGTPTVSGATHSFALSHSNYLDGVLTCTKSGITANTRTYGGLSRISLTHNYTAAVEAGLDNITVSAIQAYFRKNNVEIAKTDAGTETIALSTTSGLGNAGLGQSSSFTCAFNGSGACTTAIPFDMTLSEASKSITLTIRGQADSISNFTINPTSPSSLTVAAISSKVAGTAFTADVTVKDQFNNLTNKTCGNLAVTGGTSSPGGHGSTLTNVALPSDIAQDSLGHYTSGNITLYAEGSNTLSLAACGLSTNKNVTVTEAAVNTIYLANSDVAPASHLSSTSCTEGTTVSCPRLYAFAWDAYGNEVSDGVYSCNTWSYLDNTANTPHPSLDFASGHNSLATSSTWHMDGTIRCTSGSVVANTTVTGKIRKNYSWSCSSWSCSGTTPTASCTVSNATGYAASAYSFGGEANGTSLTTTACASGLASGGSCQVTVSGVTGNASGSLTVSATPSDSSQVTMLDPTAASVQSGANAPNCSSTLAQSISSDWACLAGAGRWTATLTNNHSFNTATFSSSDPSFSTANGASLVSSTCKSTSLTSGQSCTATVEQPSAGQSSTLVIAPNDGFFQNVSVTKASSPNCTQNATVSSTELVAKASSCLSNATNLRIRITNNNTLNTMSFGAGAVAANNGSIAADGCSGVSLSPGQYCDVDMEWTSAPGGGVSTTDITISESSAYFNDIHITSGDVNNSCP